MTGSIVNNRYWIAIPDRGLCLIKLDHFYKWIHEFNLGNANLAAGKVYKIEKKGAVVDNGVATSFAGGTGVQNNPYQISNLAQFNFERAGEN